jgi:hypothetical protein
MALIQHKSVDASALTTSLSFTSNVTAKSTLIAGFRTGGTSQTITVSDNNGNTWGPSADVAPVWISSFGSISCWSAHNANAGATQITVTYATTATTCRLAIAEYDWGGNTGQFDVGTQSNASGNTWDSTSVTTAASAPVLFGFYGNNASDNGVTAGGSFTMEELIPASPNTRAAFEDWLPGTSGTYNATGGQAVNGAWAALIAIYKQAAAGGGPPMSGRLVFVMP